MKATAMKSVFVLLCFICILLEGINAQVVLDGNISPSEYGTNNRLSDSSNSLWYVSPSGGSVCVGVQMNGGGPLLNVIVALTFDPNIQLYNQDASTSSTYPVGSGSVTFEVAANYYVYCPNGTTTCMLTDAYGAPTSNGYLSGFARNTAVAEFCLAYVGMSSANDNSIYFQGKIADGNSTVVAATPSSGFFGLVLDDRVPTGLPSNWRSLPFYTNSDGNWQAVSWFPGLPPPTYFDSNFADVHVILLNSVTLSGTVSVAHVSQLITSSLSITSTGNLTIGHTYGVSYWIIGNSSAFIAPSNAKIDFLAPVTVYANNITLPTIQLDTSFTNPSDAQFSVSNGWSADSIIMRRPINVTTSPFTVNNLRYQGTFTYTISKEFPYNSSNTLNINVESYVTVMALPPPGHSDSISSLSIGTSGAFIFGSVSDISDPPVLNVLNSLSIDGTLTASGKVYAPSIANNATIICLSSATALVYTTDGQSWPPLNIDTSLFSDAQFVELDQDTEISILNADAFTNITWYSDAEETDICNSGTCLVYAEDAVITVTATGLASGCLSTKQFTVGAPKQKKNNDILKQAVIGGLVGLGVIGIIAAIIAVVIVKRRKAKKKEQTSDVEMNNEKRKSEKNATPYNPIRSPEEPPKNESKQLLIDPKYEIPYNEITFGPELGRGAFGVVYKCRWRNTDTVVKQMDINKKDTASVELFLKEAANVLKLRTHPNVCTVFGVCTDTAYPICILMEYLPDGSLDNLIYHNKIKVDLEVVLELARDIASGMSHLHKENVLHCDLACRNLLVTTQKDKHIVKIADFGLSRVTDKDTYNASTSSTFPIRWTAPETLRSGKISRASDIWSFGVVLWEIIEGKRPYPELSNTDVVKAVCDKGYRLPRPDRIDIPPGLWRLMQECWAEDPSQRPGFDTIYQQLEEITQDVRNYQQEAKIGNQVFGVVQQTEYEARSERIQQTENTALYGNQIPEPMTNDSVYANQK